MARPGPGKGWRQTSSLGSPSSSPTARTSSLNKPAQGLDELETQVVGQASHVVVALDVGGPLASPRLDHVGVEGALHEEPHFTGMLPALGADDVRRRALERPDELPADRLTLGLRAGRVGQRGQGVQELAPGVDGAQPDAGRLHEILLDLLTLPLAQEPVVHEDAGELLSHGPLDQRRGHGGVHPAGEPGYDGVAAHEVGYRFDRRVDDAPGRPGRSDAGAAVEEVFDEALAVVGMDDFGVPLHREQAAGRVFERRYRGTFGGRRANEARG